MQYAPLTNTDVPMSEEMLFALSVLEARFICDKSISHTQVIEFLKEYALDQEFKQDYLFSLTEDLA